MAEVLSPQIEMRKDLIEGFKGSPKSIPSKYFYDERGSELFGEITRLKEYYPTRTERRILEDNIDDIGGYLGQEILLIEPGSGSSEKTRILLDHLSSIRCYIPMDISSEYLQKVVNELHERYPDIDIEPVSTDYTKELKLPELEYTGRKVLFFPGSTIGNFESDTARNFIAEIAQLTGKGGALLIGVDLKKDQSVLEAAYNDSAGITAQFNKNILFHFNRETGTDFNPETYEHKAVWVENESRIEMRLYALEDQLVRVNGNTFKIEEGEYIHTENSHKYSLAHFSDLVAPWFEVKKVWTDENNYFSLQYLVPN